MDNNELSKEWNWKYVASNLTPRKQTCFQSANMPEKEFFMLVAGAAIRRRSLSQQVQAILLDSTVKWWEAAWKEDIEFKAAQMGISPEQLFLQLIKEKLPEAVNESFEISLQQTIDTILSTEDNSCSPIEPE